MYLKQLIDIIIYKEVLFLWRTTRSVLIYLIDPVNI